ncbi:MAG: hypothetical protein O3B72_11000 [Proteobacteria bacterium]|nr:hypothetical protein [Pseudomonadota bacterium]
MKERDDELLSAYLDGELGRIETRECQERLLKEPELRRELDALASADDLLRSYAASIDERPLPEAIHGLVPVASRIFTDSVFVKFAIAAALVLGVGLVGYEATRPPASLDTVLSGERFAQDSVMVVATFLTRDDRICRELLEATSRRIVCREAGEWTTVLSTTHAAGKPGAYLPAGANTAAIDQYVMEHIQGDVLGAEEEQRLIDHGWQLKR